MSIPQYPEFSPMNLEMKDQLYPSLNELPAGISEFTFAGLYLFRNNYQYKLSQFHDYLIIHGIKEGKNFYALPHGLHEDRGFVKHLLHEVDYIKGLSEPAADSVRCWIESDGFEVWEDRDNFDYLYNREDLAELRGKKFHKKRNHVNAFVNTYSFSEAPLTPENRDHAHQVLDQWKEGREDDADYEPSKEALNRFEDLELQGHILYIDDSPVAFAMGEPLAGGSSFVVHIEKALEQYRGVYQYINKGFAASLPESFQFINREQDLGDPGLRQAKMTYRPAGFVKKFRIYPEGCSPRLHLGQTEPTMATRD